MNNDGSKFCIQLFIFCVLFLHEKSYIKKIQNSINIDKFWVENLPVDFVAFTLLVVWIKMHIVCFYALRTCQLKNM